MALVVWASLGLLLYAWIGYLVLLALGVGVRDAVEAARWLAGGQDRRRTPPAGALPHVSVVLSALDEEACIAGKVRNTLALDWPQDWLELLVGCDGCADRTAERARAAGDARVRVFESPRAGKAATLSRLVPLARGELVVLTDANVLLDPGALRALVAPFRDPAVGAVVGRLALVDPASAVEREGLYWKYETLLKYLEGRNGCVVGANGGIYAIRRLLFTPLEPDTIVDDLVVPLRVALRGWKVPFAPDAVAREETPGDTGQEFLRRVRIGAGDWQALVRHPEALDPGAGFVAFAFASHKLLRWLSPFLLAAVAVGTLARVVGGGGAAWWTLAVAQAAGYGLALAGDRAPRGLRGLAGQARHFVWIHAALAVGLWRFLRGRQRATWDRTAREAVTASPGDAMPR
ncbi:MAG: glycosyltransferase family 2 protein [Anaeromyxobacteraceae bacterium]